MRNIKRYGLLGALWLIGLLAAILTPAAWERSTPLMDALWVVIAVGTLLVAGLLTYLELQLRKPTPATPGSAHEYFSTGCLHGEHTYCQSMTGYQGEKRPGRCKFCDAQCICSCHGEGAQ